MDNSNQIQRRSYKGEIRAVTDDGGRRVIEGLAIVYDTPSDYSCPSPRGMFIEKIDPGAFLDSIANADIGCYFDHDTCKILGRTRSSTLQLSNDATGLRFRCELPDTSYANDLVTLIERGDVYGCSFGFRNFAYTWSYDGDQLIGTVVSGELFDVGPVSVPVYESTSVDLRSLESFLDGQERVRRYELDWYEFATRRLNIISQES